MTSYAVAFVHYSFRVNVSQIKYTNYKSKNLRNGLVVIE